jgi:GntR family transcriptional regulator
MNFLESQSIYLQIMEFVKEQILLGQWQPEAKVPSVRELAVELQVNPNTVMRAYDLLQQQGILQNRRGLGHYVGSDAHGKIHAERRDRFLETDLPALFRAMKILRISFPELEQQYRSYMNEQSTSAKP